MRAKKLVVNPQRELVRLDLERQSAAAPLVISQPRPSYAAVSYPAVRAVLRDPKTFPSSGYAKDIGAVIGPSILSMDDPEHGLHRRSVQAWFNRGSVLRWEAAVIKPVTRELINRFVDCGKADLVSELTFPLPVFVIAGILGLPAQDVPSFHSCAIDLLGERGDHERALRSSRRLADYLTPILEERQRRPGQDLISLLVRQGLDTAHALGFLRLLIVAGSETVFRGATSVLAGLLTHPRQLDALREDPSLLSQAVDEGLRWRAPIASIRRTCVKDTEVRGVKIPAGSEMHLLIDSANKDAAHYENPCEFDILRRRKPHIAFALGPHRCLGAHLALSEIRVAVNMVLRRLPRVRLELAGDAICSIVRSNRVPHSLPVRFNA